MTASARWLAAPRARTPLPRLALLACKCAGLPIGKACFAQAFLMAGVQKHSQQLFVVFSIALRHKVTRQLCMRRGCDR